MQSQCGAGVESREHDGSAVLRRRCESEAPAVSAPANSWRAASASLPGFPAHIASIGLSSPSTPTGTTEKWHGVVRYFAFCYSAQHPAMIKCNLSVLMGRNKLRISDVARLTGLNRSTVTALYNETATRIELPAVEQLCQLFECSVGDLFELVEGNRKAQP